MVGVRHAERVADLERQLPHLAIDFDSLVRVPQVPESHREVAAVGDARIVTGVCGPKLGGLSVFVLRNGRREAIARRRIRRDRATSHRT